MNSPRPIDYDEQRIRETAYHLWEKDGRPIGHSEVYWEMALSIARPQDAPSAAEIKATPVKKAAKAKKPVRASAKKSSGQLSVDYAAL